MEPLEGVVQFASTQGKLAMAPSSCTEGSRFRRCRCWCCSCCCCEGNGDVSQNSLQQGPLKDYVEPFRLSGCIGNAGPLAGDDNTTAAGHSWPNDSLEIPIQDVNALLGGDSKSGAASSLENRLQRRVCICMVSDFFFPSLGGVEMHIYELSLRLARRGLLYRFLCRALGERGAHRPHGTFDADHVQA